MFLIRRLLIKISTKYLVFLPLLIGFSSFSQRIEDRPEHTIDTIRIKGDHFLFIGDHAWYVRNDSTIFLPDTVEFLVRKNNMERTDAFYENLEGRMSRRKVSSLIYNQLFKKREANEPSADESSGQRFMAYENEAINNIKYSYLDIFGTDINDTTINNPNRWAAILNKSHIHTRKWVVRKNLTFRQNDRIDPEALVNSERLLRRQEYVQDARIFVDEQGSGEAELIVTTKDVFPYNFLLNPNNNNGARFGISNINIGGLGHELEYNNIEDGGSEYFYRVRNIEGTFIDGELNFSDHFMKSGFGVFFNREFVTQETKYAGGLALSDYEFGEFDFNPSTDVTSTFSYTRNYKDLWIGRSFTTSMASNFLGLKENTRAVFAARIEKSDFTDRPVVNADTNFRFHDRTNFLISLGLTSRTYYKDRFIIQYGRTEDIPTGSALGVVFGRQSGEFEDRTYAGVNFARGGYIQKFGYLNAIISMGGFFKKGFHDGILRIRSDYYTRLFTFNQYKLRQFLLMDFARALSPNEENILITENDLGIRGVTNYYLRSTSMLNLSSVSLLFTPLFVAGFNMAVFSFFDFTITSNSRNDFFGTDTFMGMGGGIRLKNDNLAISTIRLRLGYYPNAPINASTGLFNIATSTNFMIRDFDFKAPKIVEFR